MTEGAANFGAWLPPVSVVKAPYIWRDPQHHGGRSTARWVRRYNEQLIKARGMRILGTTYYGTRHVTTTNKEVKTRRRHGRI